MPKTLNILPQKMETKDIFSALAQTPNRLNFSRVFRDPIIENDYDFDYKNDYIDSVNTRFIVNTPLLDDFRNALQLQNPFVDLSDNKFGKKYAMMYDIVDSFD
ncbi:hypothetical protein [uncultured Legionella sp.]|uniref:hypothetical protein n=1 Tax=uncultured Legionella sp. TaxID=210934 RepID=UPI00262AE8DD|nr:hypothetical protein [uncultured Legionella sp.]